MSALDGTLQMGQPFDLFDIFKVSEDGSPIWVTTAPTLEEARSEVNGLQATSADNYIVLNQKTGNKIVIPYSERHMPAKRVAKRARAGR
jgi:hypothetical protein